MSYAERWAAQLAPASRAFAAAEAGEYWPVILERAGRRKAAEAWARAITSGEVGAHALARLARARADDPELSTLAFQVATTGAPQTVLEVLATLGLGHDPNVDAVAHAAIAAVRETRDAAVILATEIWADCLVETPDRHVLDRRYVPRQSPWTDIAAYHAEIIRALPDTYYKVRYRRLLAAAISEPGQLISYRDRVGDFVITDLPIIERLIDLGGITGVDESEPSETRRAMMAWWLDDRRAAAALSPDRATTRFDEGMDENAMLVRAVHAVDDTTQLDDIAHGHLTEIAENLRTFVDQRLSGQRRQHVRHDEATIARALGVVTDRSVIVNEPSIEIERLLRTVAGLADQPDERERVATILAALQPYEDAIHVQEHSRDLAITAFSRLGDLDRVETFELGSASGHALCEYVLAARRANDNPLANEILDGAFARRLRMSDLVDLIPAVNAVESHTDILLDGVRTAEDYLATLHVI